MSVFSGIVVKSAELFRGLKSEQFRGQRIRRVRIYSHTLDSCTSCLKYSIKCCFRRVIINIAYYVIRTSDCLVIM